MKSSNKEQIEKIEALKEKYYSNKHKPFRKSGILALIVFVLVIVLFLFYF